MFLRTETSEPGPRKSIRDGDRLFVGTIKKASLLLSTEVLPSRGDFTHRCINSPFEVSTGVCARRDVGKGSNLNSLQF